LDSKAFQTTPKYPDKLLIILALSVLTDLPSFQILP